MAKKVSKEKLLGARDRILGHISCMEKEAYELEISKEEMVEAFAGLYQSSGGRKNLEFKALMEYSGIYASKYTQEELDRFFIAPKPKKRQRHVYKRPNASVSPVMMTEAEEMEKEPAEIYAELVAKKTEAEAEVRLQQEASDKAMAEVSKKRKILAEAEVQLKQAQTEQESAEKQLVDALEKLRKRQYSLADAIDEMETVDVAIRELKDQNIYLVAPGYKGEIPSFGFFVSVVPVEGFADLIVEEWPEDLLPKATVEGIMKFEQVSEYKLALSYVALVGKYVLEEKPYRLLVADERVVEMLEAYL